MTCNFTAGFSFVFTCQKPAKKHVNDNQVEKNSLECKPLSFGIYIVLTVEYWGRLDLFVIPFTLDCNKYLYKLSHVAESAAK